MDTSYTGKSKEVTWESKVKLFQDLLEAVRLEFQVRQPVILPIWEFYPYGKFVTNKHQEVENPQKRYYQRIFQLSNLLLLGEIILDKGRIIPDKEELVVDKEKHIFIPKNRRFLPEI